jgi:tRNA-2-methylthio-N6-dimethylallyladenosine synthase
MTIDIIRKVRYEGAYMFKYSPREGTKAYKMDDDVTEETKAKRLQEIIDIQRQISFEINQEQIGTEEIVLIEGFSRKSDQFFSGRTDSNKIVIVPASESIKIGDYIKVNINKATSATLFASFEGDIDVQKDALPLTA